MKIAIVGTGAAGFGVSLGLRQAPSVQTVDYFDAGGDIAAPVHAAHHPDTWDKEAFVDIIRRARSGKSRSLLPPKTHFGTPAGRYTTDSGGWLYASANHGGLTRFWSANTFDFTAKDLADWPAPARDLSRYYRAVADAVGIAGNPAPDGIGTVFGSGYVNTPPLQMPAVCTDLLANLSQSEDGSIVGGANRVAIATSPSDGRACVSCGECFSGCFRGAVFSGYEGIRSLHGDAAPNIVHGRVLGIESGADSRTVVTEDGRHEGYDKVFLAAGCIGSTEIVLRSLDLWNKPVEILDNPVYVFPILRWRGFRRDIDSKYVAIASGVLGLAPRGPREAYAHVLLAPLPNLFLRNLLPSPAWPLVRSLSAVLRSMSILGKMYLHSDYGPRHRLTVTREGERRIQTGSDEGAAAEFARQWSRLRAGLAGTGFAMPPFPRMALPTSAHYAGTLPYGGKDVPVPASGEVMPGVYLCDSSVFPASPAQPLTFTIMANAMRTAVEAVNG